MPADGMFLIKFNNKQARIKTPPTNPMGNQGIDICLPHEVTIPPHGGILVDLGITAIFLSEDGMHVKPFVLAPRSGLFKTDTQPVTTVVGIIDAPYRGPLKTRIYNVSSQPVVLPQHYSPVQILYHGCSAPEWTEVDALPSMEDPERNARGSGGFGSTDGEKLYAPTLL